MRSMAGRITPRGHSIVRPLRRAAGYAHPTSPSARRSVSRAHTARPCGGDPPRGPARRRRGISRRRLEIRVEEAGLFA
jgi:hypothetical protein